MSSLTLLLGLPQKENGDGPRIKDELIRTATQLSDRNDQLLVNRTCTEKDWWLPSPNASLHK
jgi:hypothetical protein